MKYNKHTDKVENALLKLGICDKFKIDLDLVKKVTHGFVYRDIDKNNINKKKYNREKIYNHYYQIVIRDLLKILYKRNNYSAAGINCGFVYIISNPAWPDYYKIGSAIDVYNRLSSYQTSSPLRDYKIEKYMFVFNRNHVEKSIIGKYESTGEWVKSDLNDLKQILETYNVFRT